VIEANFSIITRTLHRLEELQARMVLIWLRVCLLQIHDSNASLSSSLRRRFPHARLIVGLPLEAINAGPLKVYTYTGNYIYFEELLLFSVSSTIFASFCDCNGATSIFSPFCVGICAPFVATFSGFVVLELAGAKTVFSFTILSR
jgi:hypothetical protein